MMQPLFAIVLALAAVLVPAGDAGAQAPAAEIRALWVDAFHAGIRSPAETQQLVRDAKRLNVNTLFVQVRRRADALYTNGLEPPLDDPAYDPRFDALATIVREAHAAGIQVHAWINAMPVWRDEAPPKDPSHLLNRHGTTAQGDDNWLTRTREGNVKFPVGYFLDPGHPAARDHLVAVYSDIVRRYEVDGIHFDYIRYPETDERLPRGANVGYNPVSLARFARATGRTGVPEPGDEAWMAWRRRQVTELVRRIVIEARAIKPAIKVSAAVIAWGQPPTDTRDFENTSPMQRIFQDWRSWLEEGLLDLAVPMNYAREHDPRVREWFNGWIAFEKQHKRERQLVVGVGAYLNSPENALAQIARTRAKAGNRAADGVSIFSYAVPSAPPANTGNEAAAAQPAVPPPPDRLDFLANGVAGLAGPFARPAPVPPMPWLEQPKKGFIAGTIAGGSGIVVEGVRIRVKRAGVFGGSRHITSDANGWFGVGNLKPGRYRVEIEAVRGAAPERRAEIEVQAGRVARM